MRLTSNMKINRSVASMILGSHNGAKQGGEREKRVILHNEKVKMGENVKARKKAKNKSKENRKKVKGEGREVYKKMKQFSRHRDVEETTNMIDAIHATQSSHMIY